MARPKKDESIRRTKNVMVRFTDVEYALVSCSAEQAGYPVAVYVRKQAITEKLHVHYNIVADIAELRDFARQLSHIGNNLNQIAAFFNSGGIQSRAMLEEINRCMMHSTIKIRIMMKSRHIIISSASILRIKMNADSQENERRPSAWNM